MPDLLHEVTIQGSPEKVYKALTEQDGLKSWWTIDAAAQPKEGSTAQFKFYGGQVDLQFTVDELKPGSRVAWSPISGVPDWGGTHVTWDLTAVENGTKLMFGHRDFASYDGSFAYTNFNWGWYLISLKRYVETGKGTPHTGDPNT
jgi:uncharacterized protein YndB with AHSA1/START domain